MTIDNVIELDKILLEDASVIEGHDILSSPKKFLFIIEGNDDYVFYKACVQRQGLNETQFEFVICNGKANVLKNLHRKHEFFKLSQIILFFIDKDFDDYLEKKITDDALFITDGYSFENYLVDKNCLSELLDVHSRIYKNSEKHTKIIEQYQKAYQQFTDFIKPFMKWWIECKKNDNKIEYFSLEYQHQKQPLIKIDDDFNITFIPAQKFEIVFKQQSQTKNAIINQTIHDLKNNDHHKWVHGKYALNFMVLFYKKIQKIHNVKNKKENNESLIEFLSLCISVPLNLNRFLEKYTE